MHTFEKTLREVSVFGVILVRIFQHLDQNNSEHGHFLCSENNFTNILLSLTENINLKFWPTFCYHETP